MWNKRINVLLLSFVLYIFVYLFVYLFVYYCDESNAIVRVTIVNDTTLTDAALSIDSDFGVGGGVGLLHSIFGRPSAHVHVSAPRPIHNEATALSHASLHGSTLHKLLRSHVRPSLHAPLSQMHPALPGMQHLASPGKSHVSVHVPR